MLAALPLLTMAVISNVPLFSDFDTDAPGAPPAIGGPHQPTAIVVPAGGSVLVHKSALGLSKNVVELFDDDGDYVSVDYAFDPLPFGIKRVEATFSMDSLTTAYLMQVTDVNFHVAARLIVNFQGEIWHGATELGSYQPLTPIRVRMDVDAGNKTLDITLDPELDGFADNAPTIGLPFRNPAVIDLATAHMSYNVIVGSGTSVAYDDVYVGPVSIGDEYCTTVANSTGFEATLDVVGSRVVAHDYLTLESHRLPPNEFGYYLASETQGFVANPGGSAGNLCLGGNIGRFSKQVQSSGALGAIGITVDMGKIPTSPPSPILAGASWSFQGWFRDGMTSNFTQPSVVLFE